MLTLSQLRKRREDAELIVLVHSMLPGFCTKIIDRQRFVAFVKVGGQTVMIRRRLDSKEVADRAIVTLHRGNSVITGVYAYGELAAGVVDWIRVADLFDLIDRSFVGGWWRRGCYGHEASVVEFEPCRRPGTLDLEVRVYLGNDRVRGHGLFVVSTPSFVDDVMTFVSGTLMPRHGFDLAHRFDRRDDLPIKALACYDE